MMDPPYIHKKNSCCVGWYEVLGTRSQYNLTFRLGDVLGLGLVNDFLA